MSMRKVQQNVAIIQELRHAFTGHVLINVFNGEDIDDIYALCTLKSFY